jgi:integrase
MKNIQINPLEYNIDEFNDYSFDFLDTVETAKQIFIDNINEGLVIEGEYDSLSWKFICKSRYKPVFVNFNDLHEQILFWNLDSNLIITAIKCWFLTQLPNRSVESLKKYLDYLKEFLILSHFFNDDHIENIRLFLQYECDDSKRWNLCVPTLNFLDFFEGVDSSKEYRKMVIDIKKNINIENVSGKTRKLPSAKDVLTFSFAIEKFIADIIKNTDDYFKYYPIYIWWILSNIIPMRPSKFCAIERSSLDDKNSNYFIILPRIKQKQNAHKIQIIDTILIPKKIYQILKEYIELTEPYGNCITLISPKAYKTQNNSIYREDRFTYPDLQLLIYRFYNEIVKAKYKLDFQEQIRPGDTRHFAFLNLMRQGYHPVEIARMGGHTSLQAQYHYQQHMDYWVDVEIVQLMHRFNITQESQSSFFNSFIYLDNEFINEKVLKPEPSHFTMDLEIGYCTDPDMYCQTNKCFFCKSWKISYDEFLLKKEIIQKELQSCKSDIQKLTATMKNLFSIAVNESLSEDDVSDNSIDFNRDLHYTKNQLDVALHKLATLSNKIRKEE